MKIKSVITVILLLTTSAVLATTAKKHNVKPNDGYVPNKETAVAIAVAVWNPIYGKEHIQNKKPFNASLSNGVWTVTGSLPPRTLGGVPLAEISKSDGAILRISHGK